MYKRLIRIVNTKLKPLFSMKSTLKFNIFSGAYGKRLSHHFLTCLILLSIINIRVTAQNVSVLTQHGDQKRTGWNDREKILNTGNVNSATFGKLLSMSVDDQLYAQPLVFSNLQINGAKHNVVIAATVNNTVYAFDADDGSLYWTKNFTVPGQRPPRNNDLTGACNGNYRDFSGNIGIVGTPVIDSISKTIYFVARSTDSPTSMPGTGNFFQHLHAIDITTGLPRTGSPVEIKASINGNGDGNVNGVLYFNPQKENQRAGLVLSKNIVYLTYAGHCDWAPYHGWIIGYDANNLQQKIVYNTTPDGYAGGIWMSAGAPAVDESGNIYVAVGNGSVGTKNNISDVRNRGESALKLTPNGSTLSIGSFFTPKNFQDLENADLDFGATQVLLMPNTNLAITGCKDGNIYVMDRDNMGGINLTKNNVVQTINLGSGKSLRSSFAYFKGLTKEFFYTWSENAALKAFPFNRITGQFDEANVVIGNAQGPSGANGTLLTVSSDGSKEGTGILWASHASNGDANQSVRPGILRAFDANDVTKELWNSNSNSKDGIGNYAKFVCPTVANGKVYMASFSNQLVIYGVIDTVSVAICNGNGNLAKGKNGVASSTELGANNSSKAFDGDLTTRWASSGSKDPESIYVDLGAKFDICTVKLYWEAALAKDFQIQVSDDATNWITLKTIVGNILYSNTISVKGSGRYVRMYGTGRSTNFGYSLYEFEVYGTAVKTLATPNGLAIASSSRTSVSMLWDAIIGVSYYNVQYKTIGDKSFTNIITTTNSLTLNNLSCGTDYFFKVQAVGSDTSSSDFSSTKGFSTLVCDESCGFLPTRWLTQDVGIVGITGSACFSNDIFRLKASGKDIWDKADGFRIAYKTFTGDGNVTARIDSMDNENPWNKAGIMFRESLDSNSRHALMALTSGNGAAFQYRSTTGETSFNTNITGIKAPYWVKIIKRGTKYSGYISKDSLVWTQVGQSIDLGFGTDPINAGIVITSHDNSRFSKAVFSHVPIVFSSDTSTQTIKCENFVNIALNKPAVSSSLLSVDKSIYEFKAFDGDTSTSWASAQGIDNQWIYLNLGKKFNICGVNIKWALEYAMNYEIQVSDDALNWTTLKMIIGNASLNNYISVNGIGRFVRMYAMVRGTNLGYSIKEMEVYGSEIANQPSNIALNKPGFALANENIDYLPAKAFDGLGYTRWSGAFYTDPSWMYVDLGKKYDINQVIINWELANAQDFQIQTSNDAINWVTIKSITDNNLYTNILNVTGSGRYVRMYGTKHAVGGYSIYEFEVYGNESINTSTIYEAEEAVLFGVSKSSIWYGYTGTAFGDFINPYNDYIEWSVNAPSTGNYQLDFRYALGSSLDRPLELKVNNIIIKPSLSFPNTSAWTNWNITSLTTNLNVGNNLIRLTAIGLSGPNMDHLKINNSLSSRLKPEVAARLNSKSDINLLPTINIYPVPAAGIISIDCENEITGDIQMVSITLGTIYNPSVLKKEINKIVLNIEGLKDGLYIIKIPVKGSIISKKITILH